MQIGFDHSIPFQFCVLHGVLNSSTILFPLSHISFALSLSLSRCDGRYIDLCNVDQFCPKRDSTRKTRPIGSRFGNDNRLLLRNKNDCAKGNNNWTENVKTRSSRVSDMVMCLVNPKLNYALCMTRRLECNQQNKMTKMEWRLLCGLQQNRQKHSAGTAL